MASHGHQHLQLEMASQAELESRNNDRENERSFLGRWIHQANGTKMVVSVNKKEEEEEERVKQPGGWKTMPYIIGNEACEKLATIGLLSNIVVYLTTKFNMPIVETSYVINVWSGTTNMSPLLGAFLSDSYIGRYWTIAFGCLASLIGMTLLTLTAIFPSFRPPPCINAGSGPCVGASLGQKALLYSSFAMMTIGAGGIRPCSIAFGADQFDYTSEKGKRSIQSFFNWYYFSFTIAVMISLTVIVYIQDSISWGWGMGIPAALMLFSVICFFLGKRIYVLVGPQGSSFTSFAQVIASAIKKRHLRLPSQQPRAEDFYDPPIKAELKSRMVLTDQFMFLNKAALKTDQDLISEGVVDPWRLCSLQQVEELKSVIRITPIWVSGINIFVCFAQLSTFSVLQAETMDRHLGKSFKVPAGSFGIFTMLVLTLFLPFYDRVIVPFTRRMSKCGNGITLLQRIGVGFFICILSMALAAVFEKKRRNVALSHGLMEKPTAVIPMSAFFLVPQYSVAGLAEAFSAIGFIEFLYSQFPENMRSVAGALFFLNIGIGSYVSSFLVGIVHNYTGGGHGKNWLAQNLNKGRLDYFYWLLAGLAVVNLLYFLICAQWYRYKVVLPNETKTTTENRARNTRSSQEV